MSRIFIRLGFIGLFVCRTHCERATIHSYHCKVYTIDGKRLCINTPAIDYINHSVDVADVNLTIIINIAIIISDSS